MSKFKMLVGDDADIGKRSVFKQCPSPAEAEWDRWIADGSPLYHTDERARRRGAQIHAWYDAQGNLRSDDQASSDDEIVDIPVENLIHLGDAEMMWGPASNDPTLRIIGLLEDAERLLSEASGSHDPHERMRLIESAIDDLHEIRQSINGGSVPEEPPLIVIDSLGLMGREGPNG